MVDFLADVFTAAACDPAVFFIALLCAFAAGMFAGYIARRTNDADVGTLSTPLRTNNSSLVDLQARRALQKVGVRPHARAGMSHLKPSYDGRKHAPAAHQTPDSPRA